MGFSYHRMPEVCSLMEIQSIVSIWWVDQHHCAPQAISYRILVSKVHGANMEPIVGQEDPGESHVGPTDFAIWDYGLNIQILP